MQLDDLKKKVKDGAIDTVLLGFTDMQGRLQGKRLTAEFFLDSVVRSRRGGMQLPAGRRRRHEHGQRLRDVVVGAGLRRLRDEAGHGHAARGAMARGHRARPRRPRVGRPQPGRGVAAADPAAPDRPARRARADRLRRHRARVHGVPQHLRGGVEQGLPRPRAGQLLQRRLLDDRDRPRRAARAPDPQLDGRRRHEGRERQGRVQLRPARDQLPLRAGAARRRTTTRSTRPARRRSLTRRAARSPTWRSSTSARATRATSTCRSATRTGRCSTTRSWPASSPACAS